MQHDLRMSILEHPSLFLVTSFQQFLIPPPIVYPEANATDSSKKTERSIDAVSGGVSLLGFLCFINPHPDDLTWRATKSYVQGNRKSNSSSSRGIRRQPAQ